MSNLLFNSYLRKYKLSNAVSSIISKKKIRKGAIFEALKKKICLSIRERSNVKKFLEDDANSKMCPGKRDHIEQIQKRYLSAPIKELHKKYQEEYSSKLNSLFECYYITEVKVIKFI